MGEWVQRGGDEEVQIGSYRIADVKYSIGNGVAKELILMTHRHEQEWGDCLRNGGCWVEGSKGGKMRTTVIV